MAKQDEKAAINKSGDVNETHQPNPLLDRIAKAEEALAAAAVRQNKSDEQIQKLSENMVKAAEAIVAISKSAPNAAPASFKLWTDNPMNLFSLFIKSYHRGNKNDFLETVEFATVGLLYYNRVIPRTMLKQGNEARLAENQRITGILNILTGGGKYYQCPPAEADYVVYVGAPADEHDANLFVVDPQKHSETPKDYTVGVIIGFTLKNPMTATEPPKA